MLGEFLLRLAIVLPLVCGLAVLSLYAVRRGWLRLPGLMLSGADRRAVAHASGPELAILSVKSLSPAARVALVRFAGRDLLVGISSQGLSLLAESGASAHESAANPLARQKAAILPTETPEIAR